MLQINGKSATLIDYTEQSKPQKRQIINFIRKQYSCTYINVKDIISNYYQAVLQDGKLVAVCNKLKTS